MSKQKHVTIQAVAFCGSEREFEKEALFSHLEHNQDPDIWQYYLSLQFFHPDWKDYEKLLRIYEKKKKLSPVFEVVGDLFSQKKQKNESE